MKTIENLKYDQRVAFEMRRWVKCHPGAPRSRQIKEFNIIADSVALQMEMEKNNRREKVAA